MQTLSLDNGSTCKLAILFTPSLVLVLLTKNKIPSTKQALFLVKYSNSKRPDTHVLPVYIHQAA
jgi:hypothetical protein